ncbi:ATP-dependent nuclease [Psychroflexus tropicus]|uniref:ATP-dependent nuclease n=1 Tax=Psychroflexus tropicus TaxID=197345 RepID=UPI00035D05CD|nr:AAA family ATPase [Psychroflexus tropicus]
MNLDFSDYKITNADKINIILGKNGSGKSTFLTNLESNYASDETKNFKYITPERAGTLKYEPNVERNIERDDNWLSNDRRKNQTTQFKQQSISQYRKLQLLYYQELDKDMQQRRNENHTFEKTILGKINSLLENIEIKPTTNGIETFVKGTTTKIPTEKISSGESELISLAIECLVFAKESDKEKQNFLLLDEPDVHLHPDLQYKLGQFLKELVVEYELIIFIATHSTAFVGAFTDYQNATFGLISFKQKEIDFKKINEVYKRILPVFGAHPLSNLFNESPIFLIEGEDDLRIWQQAIRTSEGLLKIYPVDIDGIDHFADYEKSIIEIVNSIYDSPIAYSVRDKDEIEDDIDDIPPLKRYRLVCRAAENLILSDEVLDSLGTNWETFKNRLDNWIDNRKDHPKFEKMNEFKQSGYDRLSFKLKEIRNILIGETGTSKPWEVAVGQVIGRLAKGDLAKDYSEGKISNFIGQNLMNELIK